MNKDNIRRFTFRIHLTGGVYHDVLRECDRPKPPDPWWVLSDQLSLYTSIANKGWVRIKTIQGEMKMVQLRHVISLDLIDIKEGLDIAAIQAKIQNKKG